MKNRELHIGDTIYWLEGYEYNGRKLLRISKFHDCSGSTIVIESDHLDELMKNLQELKEEGI